VIWGKFELTPSSPPWAEAEGERHPLESRVYLIEYGFRSFFCPFFAPLTLFCSRASKGSNAHSFFLFVCLDRWVLRTSFPRSFFVRPPGPHAFRGPPHKIFFFRVVMFPLRFPRPRGVLGRASFPPSFSRSPGPMPVLVLNLPL